MDEEKLNISIRKFLKGVGINSQRIIEKRIRDIVENDKNADLSKVKVTMQITSPELQIDEKIDGQIDID
ncbi:MAG: DUF6494 family protein [Alphaproteobacteria bacterium]|jgi:hypothetical protein|tara:strand:- start:281 stop:487 length:207 start_codon:yes stop_codon:yes gene_type:complete